MGDSMNRNDRKYHNQYYDTDYADADARHSHRQKPKQPAQRGRHHATQKRRKAFHPIRTFFKIVVSMVFAFLLLSSGAVFAYYKITGELPFAGNHSGAIQGSDLHILDALLKRDIKMNVAVFGTDKDGSRTDVMFVIHYDSKAESLDLLSLPRDTRVSVCDDVIKNYEKNGNAYNQVTKLNAIHSYSQGKLCCENTVLQIEDLLRINIDHYIKVDLDAFRKIVDTVGGVQVNVPQNMDYDDPAQDLHIHLTAGLQTLDGDMAEQLVRFRKYPTGDQGRIEVQQLFLNALAEKVLNSENILSNLPKYISILYEDIHTDISLSDSVKYANYIKKINLQNITMQTLPGSGQYVGNVSYFLHDAEETSALVDQIFYTEKAAAPDSPAHSSKSDTIQVVNGGNINGLAANYTNKLKEDGFTLAAAENFTGTQQTYTRIQVSADGMGEDLMDYFANPKIEVVPKELPEGIDIRIILGTEER